MKRIAYVQNWDSRWGRGILNMVLDQLTVWQERGYDVRLFSLTRHDPGGDLVSLVGSRVPLVVRNCRGIADRFIQYYPLASMVAKWKPDIVYARFEGCYPALVTLAAHIPLVLEIQTDDLAEYQLGPAYRHIYNRLTRGWLLARARGMVFLSHELAQKAHYTCFRKLSTVVSNGIDLSSYPPLPPEHNSWPRLVFIGSPGAPWHGIDKLGLLADRYPDWHFDIIGVPSAEVPEMVMPNVTFHGILDRVHCEDICKRADVGIGTLALHRKDMEEASPLKVRQYLALGLPIIIAYVDSDLPEPRPYILQLPNTPDNVATHLSTIGRFVEQVKGLRVPRAEICHLDTRQKEGVRLEFLNSLVNG